MRYETDEELIQQLKERYARQYNEFNRNLGSERYYKDACYYFRGEVVPVLPADRNARILEIGCGTGLLLRFLCESGYKRIGAIEIERNLYEAARKNVGERVEFLKQADAMDFLPSVEGQYDMVIAIDVVEHFPLRQAAELCHLVHDALRPGGAVLLRTPNMANILGCYSLHMGLTHFMGYTETSLRELLLLCGFARADVVVPKFGLLHLQTFRLAVTNVFHRILFAMQGRPPCVRFDENIVMIARKSA